MTASFSEFFVASDPSAILEYTRSVVYLEDGDLGVVTPDGFEVRDLEGKTQEREKDFLDWELEAIDLGQHAHYMRKEILEQPRSITDTLRGRVLVDQGAVRLDGLRLDPEDMIDLARIVILGCGTSWHAGLAGRYMLHKHIHGSALT